MSTLPSSIPAPLGQATLPAAVTTLRRGSRMQHALAVRLTRVAAKLTEHLSCYAPTCFQLSARISSRLADVIALAPALAAIADAGG